jgi:hypothetical protein
VALAAGLRAIQGRAHRWGFFFGTAAACVVLALAAYAPFWRGGEPIALLHIDRRVGMFTASLPALIQAHLEASIGTDPSRRITALGAAALTVAVVMLAIRSVWRRTGWLAPVRASAIVLTSYLLFTCLWFQPWYAIWPLALAALLPEGALGRLIVLLSYSALWKTIIFDFMLYRGGPLPPRLWRETWLGPATLGIAWLYAAYAALRGWGRRASGRRSPAIGDRT